MIFRQRYFGTFVSSGFIVMAYAKGCATSFFHPFFQCHWQGNAIQEGREIRRWIFSFFFLFRFLRLRSRNKRSIRNAWLSLRVTRRINFFQNQLNRFSCRTENISSYAILYIEGNFLKLLVHLPMRHGREIYKYSYLKYITYSRDVFTWWKIVVRKLNR